MISLFCYLNEKYQHYKLSKLLKKLDKPINIDLTSLRSKYLKSIEKKDKSDLKIDQNNHKIIIILSITYDPDTHLLQVSHLELMEQQQEERQDQPV